MQPAVLDFPPPLAVEPTPLEIALSRMACGGTDDRLKLAAGIDRALFTGRTRILWDLYCENAEKGHSATTIRPFIERAGCGREHDRVLDDLSGASHDDASVEALIEAANEYGQKQAVLRLAEGVPKQIAAGALASDVLTRLLEQAQAVGRIASPDPRFVLRDDEELGNLAPTEMLIEGVLPDDAVVTVVGPSGSFKSFLVLDWCFHIRTGLDWHGRKTNVGEVVYLCGEGANGIARRAEAWKALNNYTGRLGVHFLTNGLNLNDPVEVRGVIGAIEAKELNPKLIVVDTLSRFLVGDENTSKDMTAFLRALDQMRIRFGCTVVCVHHTGKDVQKGGRGSNSLFSNVDAEIIVERDGQDMQMTVSSKKQKDGITGVLATVEAVQIAHSLALKPSKPNCGKLAGKNLACLLALSEQDEGTGLKYGEWFNGSGEGKGTFDKARRWLQSNGYLRSDSGRYSVSEAGRMSLRSTQSADGLPQVYSPPSGFVHSVGDYSTPGQNQDSALDREAGLERVAK